MTLEQHGTLITYGQQHSMASTTGVISVGRMRNGMRCRRDPLGPLLEGGQRIVHRLSTGYPPKMGVLHRVIPIFGAKVVDKGIAIVSSLQVHLFQKDFSLSVGAYFIIGSGLFAR
jgi:hypothetical protein